MSPPPDGDDPGFTAPSEEPTDDDSRDDGDTGRSAETASGRGSWRSREVEVPMRVYKTVTVFATLIAVISVLAGFVLLDYATNRAQLPLAEVDAGVALLGVGAIVFGAAVYAFSTRFRAVGMGKPNSDGGQGDDDG